MKNRLNAFFVRQTTRTEVIVYVSVVLTLREWVSK